jgi:hypothetical protein
MERNVGFTEHLSTCRVTAALLPRLGFIPVQEATRVPIWPPIALERRTKGSTAHKDDWFYRHPDEISTLVLVHLDFRGTLPRKVQPPQARRGPGWPKRRPLWSCFRGVRERSWSGRANFTVGRSTTGAQFPRPGIPLPRQPVLRTSSVLAMARIGPAQILSCLGTCRPHTFNQDLRSVSLRLNFFQGGIMVPPCHPAGDAPRLPTDSEKVATGPHRTR